MTAPEIFFVNPNSLKAHPLLDGIPMLDDASPEFQALRASIRDRGVDVPVILDEDDRILDGRNRVRAAAREGASLPAMKRSSREASEIICSALVNRRHLPKGALAYLTAPLFAGAVEEGRARRLSNLQSGSSPRTPTQSGIGKTVEQLAVEMGFSADLYEQAVKVRKLFADPKPRTWKDGDREVEFTYKAWFEPKILSGEIGLGAVIQAVAGKEATQGKSVPKGDLVTLITRGFTDLKNRFERWESLTPEVRQTLTRDLAVEATKWPEDVRQELLSALTDAAAHRPTTSQY